MGDLFDGYGDALARQHAEAIVPAFDEMFRGTDPDGDLDPRRAYRDLYDVLAGMNQEQIRHRSDALADSYLAQGVTFDFAGEERPFPLDVVPRVIERTEWQKIEAGLKQRVRALEHFLDDVYGEQRAIADGLIPAKLISSSIHYHRVAKGIRPSNGVRIQVSGIDLIRDEHGEMRVLEDNVRVPSGVSYVISNRRAMAQTLPELFTRMRVLPVGDYPHRLLAALRASAPEGVDDPTVVVLTPGVYNSAYFEHTLLARLMGVELVEGRDLFTSGGRVWMRTTAGPRRVDVIYRRVDDDFLDPLHFRRDSMLGSPGLMTAALQGRVTLANAVGNGVADDKLVYTYMPALIRYYLSEDAIIPNVDTWRLEEPDALEEVLDRLDELVVKPVDGSGGKGLMIGPKASKLELELMRERLLKDPRGWIAQPVVQLSTIPTLVDEGMRPRHADLRPFAVNDGNDVWVLPGGLTRVALPEGQLVVNSSQGGGSKDTWVVGSERSFVQTQSQSQSHGVEELLDDQTDASDTAHPATGVLRIIPPKSDPVDESSRRRDDARGEATGDRHRSEPERPAPLRAEQAYVSDPAVTRPAPRHAHPPGERAPGERAPGDAAGVARQDQSPPDGPPPGVVDQQEQQQQATTCAAAGSEETPC
ncbi:putative circularly permuted ATP-grasp superfamily protein [Pseudoclavibacter chungangensis]|uniref:circularly permuted type 2 ATP-grasp protein n=1 Tax=Pseudoclavibacter chungangensis TaxID=587635 RepID=UPI00179CF7E5|nr:circularly permuted type 2 ATP-grasp protein [Pseudoclavibacter chungangensis]NYJ68159.1 putative circularly permuted ATP-grasp superfamily protein [Pseudoclavibacter chungangensis]